MVAHPEPAAQLETSVGPARVFRTGPARPLALAVLGHGAGGGVFTDDLTLLTTVLSGRGFAVVRLEQPYRVAGRRAPPAAPVLDAAFGEAVAVLRAEHPGLPLVTGGRSMGARVACRTAAQVGAAAVLALSFPLHPPGRGQRSRAGELQAAGCPVAVLQGERDPFGRPAELPPVAYLSAVPGAGHELRGLTAELAVGVADFLLRAAGESARHR